MNDEIARRQFQEADRLYRAGQFGDGLAILEKLNAAFPEQKNVLYPMALCLAGLGRADEAQRIHDFLQSRFADKRCPHLQQAISQAQSTVPISVPGGLDLDVALPDADLLGDFDTAPRPPIAPRAAVDSNRDIPWLLIAGIAALVLVIGGLAALPLLNSGDTTAAPEPTSATVSDESSEEQQARREESAVWTAGVVTFLFSLVTLPGPLLVARLFTGTAIFDDFRQSYFECWIGSFLAGLLMLFPCLPLFLGLYYLNKKFELGLVGILIYIGASVVLYFIQFAVQTGAYALGAALV